MFKWFSNLFAAGLKPEAVAERLGVALAELKSVDLSYREFRIAKKSGKLRTIHAPNADLKKLQRKILRRLLAKLKTHPQATGFQPNVSFVDNARCHQCQAIVVRIDLVDFFPSIDASRLRKYFRKIGWSKSATELLTGLTTYQDRLPQGAPTSPRLSNLVNFRLDCRLAKWADQQGAIYTRYADDITFSFSDANADVHEFVKRAIKIIRDEGYQPHLKKKFDIRRQHHRQIVTGLVVNQKVALPREVRRRLRAIRHRAALAENGGYVGPTPTLTDEQLAGWASLEEMINEP